MLTLSKTSETLLGTLSREADFIYCRAKNISDSIINIQDQDLIKRLKCEFNGLEKRREELHRIALSIKEISSIKNMSVDLLIQICKTPIVIV